MMSQGQAEVEDGRWVAYLRCSFLRGGTAGAPCFCRRWEGRSHMSTEPGSAPPGQPWLEGQLCCAPSCLEKQPVLMAITWEKGPGGWGQGGGGRQRGKESSKPLEMMPECSYMDLLGEFYW